MSGSLEGLNRLKQLEPSPSPQSPEPASKEDKEEDRKKDKKEDKKEDKTVAQEAIDKGDADPGDANQKVQA